MFYGREKELKQLNKLYNSDKFEFVVMYGRRRVGKTRLLTEFVQDKENIFVVGEEFNERTALVNFTNRIAEYLGLSMLPAFASFKDAFDFIVNNKKDGRLVIVFDEFQYIANTNKSLLSFLQNYIDHVLANQNILLIICGSSISFMENEVLAYKRPLYGRHTAQFVIKPFDFFYAKKFYGKIESEAAVKYYATLGGIPKYILAFDYKKTYKQNVCENILNENAFLYEETTNLLKQELREVAVYNQIIEAVKGGYSKLNEIATKVGVSTDSVSKYLNKLCELKIISKEVPFNEKTTSRKTIYRIQDMYYRFYYNFVYNNKSLIEQDRTEYVYEKIIDERINEYVSYAFETICKEYIIRLNMQDKLPFVARNIGKWWGTNNLTKSQEEIDVVAADDENIIIGECKYTKNMVGVDVYEKVKRVGGMFSYKNMYYYIFSKNGFEQNLLDIAKKDNRLVLVTLDDIVKLEV